MKAALEKWLIPYISDSLARKNRCKAGDSPIHILFCLADHFEPGCGKADLDIQRRRVDYWVEHYPKIATEFRDSDGYMPQHTFFFSPHEDNEHLVRLVDLCKKGFGEIELHLHHDHIPPFPDNSETLEEKILKSVEKYAKIGIFGKNKLSGNRSFGFIHGDWALDNSMGGRFCGVNNELEILGKTGCYADFTFPSICESQPGKINSIYYAMDNPNKPKSYNTGIDVEAGKNCNGGLMIIEGPLGLRRKKTAPFFAIEAANISKSDIPTEDRIDFWVKKSVAVKGRPDWVVVKVHAHGAVEKNFEVLLGKPAYRMHQHLQDKYNDNKNYKLHYVTARQLYNIIKAAEALLTGSPGDFRDFLIEPPICVRKERKA